MANIAKLADGFVFSLSGDDPAAEHPIPCSVELSGNGTCGGQKPAITAPSKTQIAIGAFSGGDTPVHSADFKLLAHSIPVVKK